MSSNISGLASSVRAATESETFDLAGQNQNTISTTIEAAFSTPLPIQHMIRITFITGAGKLGRQKYDENAARVVTSTLRKLGYEEDRAASCVVECAGSFKSQHDTGKNLKTIVVFPNVNIPNEGNEMDQNTSAMSHINLDTNNASSKLPNGSPKHMCAISAMPTFTKMLSAKCPSWSQKKGCLSAIQSVMEIVQSMEDQLGKGQPLSEADQDLFDSISVDALNQKETFVKKEMQQQVDDGKLTSSEKEMLLAQVKEKISKVEEELKVAQKDKKPKKEAKLNTMLEKLKTRKEKLDNIVAQPPHPLRLQSEIVKLRVEMVPLQKMVDSAKGRLLSMKETKTLARRDEILQEIEELEQKSRGWFESDESFQSRVQYSQKSSSATANQRTLKKKSVSNTNKNMVFKKSTTAWVTPGMKTQKKAPARTKKTGNAGSVFAAMMMDSDSD